MDLQLYFINLLPLIISLGISLAIGAYAWQQRTVKGVRGYSIYAFSQALWTFGYILELLSPSLESKIFWDDFQYLGYLGAIYGSIIFVLLYTDIWSAKSRVPRISLSIFFTLINVIALTNHWHGLVGSDYELISYPPFDVLTYRFEPLGLMMIGLFYVIFIGLIILLARHALKQKPFYRLQELIMVFGFLLPTIFSFNIFLSITYLGQRDITPLSFGLANILIAWGLFRYRLFDLRPIARAVVLENLKAAVFVFDANNRLVDWNPIANEYFNVTTRAKLGDDFMTVFSPVSDIAEQYVNHITLNTEITANDITVDVQISPLIAKNGEVVGKLVMLYDMTEQVAIREQLRQRSVELENANAELMIARNKAEEADRIKSQFVSTMSHELRTPLSAMMIFIELVLSERYGLLTPKQKDSLTKSMTSGRHLLSLINDVLDITKIEAGMMSFLFEDNVDLRPDIEAVESTALSLLQNKPITWVSEIMDDLPLVHCDRRRIFQVLLNLVSNACKFTEKGEILLRVTQEDNHLLFTVRDSGTGIPVEEFDNIFHPFKQSDSGLRHATGTGLGLPISQHLVESHKGRIWLESELGKGTTFFVTLPIKNTDKSNLPPK